MAFRFKPGEQLHEAFSRAALEGVEGARTDLASSKLARDQAIHQARRRFKKMRALIRLARPSLGPAYAAQNRFWRDAGRLLAASRDATVLLASFDKIAAQCADTLPASALAAIREALDQRSARDAGHGGDQRADVLDLLEAAPRDMAKLNWPRDAGELARGFRDSQARLRRSWKLARANPDSEALHEWRKRVKDHWTQLGLVRAVLPPEVEACRADAKVVAELLGEEHDLALLHDAIAGASKPASARQAARRLIDAVDARREELRKSALQRGETLSSRAPKAVGREMLSAWEATGPDAPEAKRKGPGQVNGRQAQAR